MERNKKIRRVMQNQQKLAWRPLEIARAVGVSLPFVRKELRKGRLKSRRLGAAVVVLDRDLKSWLDDVAKDEK
jgi:hypothetical protein